MDKLTLYTISFNLIIRRLTASLRTLPSVFILGATKSGSSSLTNILGQHPAHVPPLTKELMYLIKLAGFDTNWERFKPLATLGGYADGHSKYSLNGYRKFFPTNTQMNARARKTGESFTSDCDPFNLYCPVATERIQSFAKAPRFIISLRDPIERAYSDYRMYLQFLKMPSFEDCIELELNDIETRFRFRFLNQSLYAEHLVRWIQAFGRDRIHFVKAEDFFQEPATITENMFRFLGLQKTRIPGLDFSVQNKSQNESDLNPKTRERLQEYFYEPNEKVKSLLGDHFNWNQDQTKTSMKK